MKRIINILVICLLAALATVRTFAAPEAEYGKIAKSWILNTDGSQEYRFSMELTLFTHTAMNSTYGESFIVYNPDRQELKIHTSYTKQKDGSIIETPENAFVEVLPRYAADAPAYNSLKEMVVVHTGLELGATIYLDYSIISKPGFYPALDINEFLQETSPVKEYLVSVSAPENVSLEYQQIAFRNKAKKSKGAGMQHLNWRLKNVDALSREPFQLQNRDEVPRLLLSAYSSNGDALKVLADRFDRSFSVETEAYAQFITEGVSNAGEKVDIIRKYVATNLSNSGVPLEIMGFAVRNADDVLRSAYGTAAEKTAVLSKMLNAVGIKSDIVAVYPAFAKADCCGLKAIKTLEVRAVVDGKEEFLTAISQASSTIPQRGESDRIVMLNGRELKQEAMYTNIDEKKELTLNVEEAQDGYLVYTLPAVTNGVDRWNISNLNSARKTVFEIPSLIREKVTYNITLPEGMELRTPAAFNTKSFSFGYVSQTVMVKDGVVHVERHIELYRRQFTPEEYANLRVLLNEWTDPMKRQLLFSVY